MIEGNRNSGFSSVCEGRVTVSISRQILFLTEWAERMLVLNPKVLNPYFTTGTWEGSIFWHNTNVLFIEWVNACTLALVSSPFLALSFLPFLIFSFSEGLFHLQERSHGFKLCAWPQTQPWSPPLLGLFRFVNYVGLCCCSHHLMLTWLCSGSLKAQCVSHQH